MSKKKKEKKKPKTAITCLSNLQSHKQKVPFILTKFDLFNKCESSFLKICSFRTGENFNSSLSSNMKELVKTQNKITKFHAIFPYFEESALIHEVHSSISFSANEYFNKDNILKKILAINFNSLSFYYFFRKNIYLLINFMNVCKLHQRKNGFLNIGFQPNSSLAIDFAKGSWSLEHDFTLLIKILLTMRAYFQRVNWRAFDRNLYVPFNAPVYWSRSNFPCFQLLEKIAMLAKINSFRECKSSILMSSKKPELDGKNKSNLYFLLREKHALRLTSNEICRRDKNKLKQQILNTSSKLMQNGMAKMKGFADEKLGSQVFNSKLADGLSSKNQFCIFEGKGKTGSNIRKNQIDTSKDKKERNINSMTISKYFKLQKKVTVQRDSRYGIYNNKKILPIKKNKHKNNFELKMNLLNNYFTVHYKTLKRHSFRKNDMIINGPEENSRFLRDHPTKTPKSFFQKTRKNELSAKKRDKNVILTQEESNDEPLNLCIRKSSETSKALFDSSKVTNMKENLTLSHDSTRASFAHLQQENKILHVSAVSFSKNVHNSLFDEVIENNINCIALHANSTIENGSPATHFNKELCNSMSFNMKEKCTQEECLKYMCPIKEFSKIEKMQFSRLSQKKLYEKEIISRQESEISHQRENIIDQEVPDVENLPLYNTIPDSLYQGKFYWKKDDQNETDKASQMSAVIQPLAYLPKMPTRPIRVGLSRKQRVQSLHPYLKEDVRR